MPDENNGALSIESALSLLATPPQETSTEETPQTEAVEATEQDTAAEAVQESTEDAPVEEQASSDDSEEVAEADPQPIDPPSSWSKADKELFSSLPLEAQQAIAQREKARDNEIFRRQQEFAEQQKELSEKLAAMETERQKYLEKLVSDAPKPPSKELLDSDPVEYLKQQAAYTEALQEQEKAKAEYQQKTQEQYKAWITEEARKLSDPASPVHIPGYADKEKGAEIRKSLAKYATDLGVPAENLSRLSATEAHVLWKAQQWDKAQASAKEAKAKPIPKVSAPGTAKSKADVAADKRQEALRRLDKTGSLEDALALMRMN